MKKPFTSVTFDFKKQLAIILLSLTFIFYSLMSVSQTGNWENGMETRTLSDLGVGTLNPDGKTEILYTLPTINGLVLTRINTGTNTTGTGSAENPVIITDIPAIPDLSGSGSGIFNYPDLRLQMFNSQDKPLFMGRVFEVQENIFKNKLILTSSGNMSLNNDFPRSALDVVSKRMTSNSPTVIFGIKTSVNSDFTRHIQFVNKLSENGYSNLSENGDQGIFWTDGTGTATQNSGTQIQTIEGTNLSSGLVIAPWNHSNDGVKITFDGNVGIGIQKPKGKLDVNGKIYCKSFELTNPGGITIMKITPTGNVWAQEVKVKVNDPYPDYVFAKDFMLISLTELEAYLKLNQHLPDVPAEKEISENGIELGKMNLILLKKIEEMTLYMIMLNREIEKLKAKIPEK